MDGSDWVLDNCAHLQALGLELERREAGYVELRLPFDESLTTPGAGAIHGGTVATLVDNAAGAALRTTLEEPRAVPHATTDLTVSYLRPATADLRAAATVLRAGSSMAVVRVEVSAVDGEAAGSTVAEGRVSLHLERSDGGDPTDGG